MDGFDHGKDIFQRRAWLDVMAGGTNKAFASGAQSAQAILHLGAHLIHGAAGQDALVVHAAVEDDPMAELFALPLATTDIGPARLAC